MTPDTNLLITLDRLRHVAVSVLAELVCRDGACMWPRSAGEPPWLVDDLTDRELADLLCDECTVRRECLELDLRTAGPTTVGVWGGMTEDERRALYPLWERRRSS